jgi:hypothetical protein
MNETKFNFSITNAIKNSWSIFKNNPLFYVSLTLVLVILNLAVKLHESSWIVVLLACICALIWSYTWFSISLNSVDGKIDRLNFKSIPLHFPKFKQFMSMLGIGIVMMLILSLAFIPFGLSLLLSNSGGLIDLNLYVILGLAVSLLLAVYLGIKLSLTNLSYVDRQEGIMNSIKHSWNIVQGNIFWTVLLTAIVYAFLTAIGSILFGLVFLLTYPISILLFAQLYRAVNKHYIESTSIAEQPKEISA